MAEEYNSDHVVKITADMSDVDQKLDNAGKKLDTIDSKAKKTGSTFSDLGKKITNSMNFSDIGKSMSSAVDRVVAQENKMVDSLRIDAATDTMAKSLDKVGDRIDTVTKKSDNIRSIWEKMVKPVGYFSEDAEKLRGTVSDLKDQMDTMLEGFNEEAQTTKARASEIRQLLNDMVDSRQTSQNIDTIKEKMATMVQADELRMQVYQMQKELGKLPETFTEEANKLKAEIPALRAQMQGVTDDAAKDAEQTKQKIAELEEKLSGMKEPRMFTDEWYDLGDQLKELEKRYDSLNKKAERFANNPPKNAAAVQTVNTQLDETKQKIDEVKSKMDTLNESGANITPGWSATGWNDPYHQMQEELANLKQHMQDIGGYSMTPGVDTSEYKAFEGRLDYIQKRLQEIGADTETPGVNTKEYQDLTQKIEEAQERMHELGITDETPGVDSMEYEDLDEQLKLSQTHVEELKNKIGELADLKVPTDTFKTLQDELAKAEAQLIKYLNKQEKMEGTGVKKSSQSWKNLQFDINAAEEECERYEKSMDKMLESGTAYKPTVDTDEYKSFQEELQACIERMKEIGADTETPGVNTQEYQDLNDQLEQTKVKLQEVENQGLSSIGNTLYNGFQQVGDRIVAFFTQIASKIKSLLTSAIKTALSTIGNIAKNLITMQFKPFVSVVKKLANSFNLLKKAVTGTGDIVRDVTNSLTSFFTMLKTRIKRLAISAIFNDIKENFGQMAQVSAEFNSSVSSMIDSAKQLGAQILAIIEPIVNIVGPILTSVMDSLENVADKAAQFVARLTGNDTYIKASKGVSNYAASLDDATDSTEAATTATKEYQASVLGFDQLNKMNAFTSAADTSSDLDTVESVTGISEATLTKAQTQETKLNKIADKIHEILSNHDWKGLGESMAEGVNAAFSWLDNAVGWEANGEKISKVVQNVVDTLNSFIQNLDPETIGHAIGDILATPINILDEFTDPENGFDFKGAGQKLAQILIKAIENIPWDTLGEALMQTIQGGLQFLNGLLGKDDEGENVGSKLGEGVSEAIGAAIDALDPEVWSDFILNLWDNVWDFMEKVFDNPDQFKELGEKLGTAVNNIITGFNDSSWQNTWNSILGEVITLDDKTGQKVKSVYDSADEATRKDITQDIKDAIADGQKMYDVNGNEITQEVIDAYEDGYYQSFTKAISDATNDPDYQESAIDAFIGGFTSNVDTSDIGDFANTLIDDTIGNMWLRIKKFIQDYGPDIAKLIDTLWQQIKPTVLDIAEEIGEAIWEGITSAFKIGNIADTLTSNAATGIGNLFARLVGWATGADSDEVDLTTEYNKLTNQEYKKLKKEARNNGEGFFKSLNDESLYEQAQEAAWDDLEAKYGDITEYLQQQADDMSESVSDVGTTFTEASDLFSAVTDTAKGVQTSWDDLETDVTSVSDSMSGIADDVTGVSDTMGSIADTMAQTAQSAQDTTEIWKQIAKDTEAITNSNSDTSSGNIFSSRISHNASGGIVGDGQLFIANENGAEMIGKTDNGQTAVVNNQQIVSAVSQGVRQAVSEALASSGSSDTDTGTQDIVLRVDSEELARATVRGQRRINKRTNSMVSFA